ncbi:hypothetical protein BU26DRAFT_143819 [Trematosphaeria pertusa]|uniref:Uncharacterized protein n=1 Tax=Trematosphaeria pertusa TaxID=390896 RepID=A0A6A6IVX3_9PLEO|nr:uncharacterized protein BU26DRAFT_143819 [Trematosphaeria pertusa]KAF2254701.1 hypothetical protein BU26DRAFT_143819 [Trematosphaeria pertusa]
MQVHSSVRRRLFASRQHPKTALPNRSNAHQALHFQHRWRQQLTHALKRMLVYACLVSPEYNCGLLGASLICAVRRSAFNAPYSHVWTSYNR